MNAQVYDLVILDSKSGIVGVQVNDITQDAEGYIWVATNGGVSRYDGKNFVNYVRRDGLAENNCTAIFCDSENRVWVGHQTAGISIIFPDSIQRISEVDGLANNGHSSAFLKARWRICMQSVINELARSVWSGHGEAGHVAAVSLSYF